jgi:hypothetical protein
MGWQRTAYGCERRLDPTQSYSTYLLGIVAGGISTSHALMQEGGQMSFTSVLLLFPYDHKVVAPP